MWLEYALAMRPPRPRCCGGQCSGRIIRALIGSSSPMFLVTITIWFGKMLVKLNLTFGVILVSQIFKLLNLSKVSFNLLKSCSKFGNNVTWYCYRIWQMFSTFLQWYFEKIVNVANSFVWSGAEVRKSRRNPILKILWFLNIGKNRFWFSREEALQSLVTRALFLIITISGFLF